MNYKIPRNQATSKQRAPAAVVTCRSTLPPVRIITYLGVVSPPVISQPFPSPMLLVDTLSTWIPFSPMGLRWSDFLARSRLRETETRCVALKLGSADFIVIELDDCY